MHLPGAVNDYCNELIQQRAGAMNSPQLIMTRAQASAMAIMQDMVSGGGSKLERLTLHLTRTECDARGDPWKL